MSKKAIQAVVKTMPVTLKYIRIKGEGKEGLDGKFYYSASAIMKKDSPEHKHIAAQVNAVWKEYAESLGLKIAPKSTGIKPIMVSSGKTDEFGAEIMKESDEVIVNFKTAVTWPNGKPKVVKVLQPSGKDITDAMLKADWSIGDDTIGILHGTAIGNDAGKAHKVTLYLTGVQIHSNIQKYTGTAIDADSYDDEDDIVFDVEMDTDSGEAPQV